MVNKIVIVNAAEADRAAQFGRDAINWIASVKGLATKQRNSRNRIADSTIRYSEFEAHQAAVKAARFARRALGEQ